jgi:hypothetical protein
MPSLPGKASRLLAAPHIRICIRIGPWGTIAGRQLDFEFDEFIP